MTNQITHMKRLFRDLSIREVHHGSAGTTTTGLKAGVYHVLRCSKLTRDNLGVCISTVNIDIATTAAMAYPKGEKTFKVNGQDVRGWCTRYGKSYKMEELNELDEVRMETIKFIEDKLE